MKWLEVRLTVSGELAEPIAELLARYCTDGVVMTAADQQVMSSGQGTQLAVVGYLPINQETDTTRRQIEEGLWHLSQIQPLPEPTFKSIEEQDWSETWRQHYKPIPIGARLLVQPPWIDPEAEDRIIVQIDPGMAFGTGTHPTTILCLELMENYLKPGATVVDLGCGTGILSIAAAKLGAGQVYAFDLDPDAVQAARSNAADNRVLDQLHLRQGSLDDLRQEVASGLKANLIVVNILASVLTDFLKQGLPELLTRDAILILSGILEEQAEDLESLADRVGLRLEAKTQRGDWIALGLKMNPPLSRERDINES